MSNNQVTVVLGSQWGDEGKGKQWIYQPCLYYNSHANVDRQFCKKKLS
jgi:hypothetical protein